MARRIAQLIWIALAAAVVVGCSTSPSRFYSLASTATADGTPATAATVMVGPVTIPAAVDQPEFVVQVAPNRVEVNEFNRWVSPLNDSIGDPSSSSWRNASCFSAVSPVCGWNQCVK